MKNILFLLITIFTINSTHAQSKSCKEFLSKEVFPNETSGAYVDEVWGLINCGLDSIEIQMLSNQTYMGTVMIQWMTGEDKVMIYKDLLTHFNDFKKTEHYSPIYKSVGALEKMKVTTVSLANWEKDKEELLRLVVSEEYIGLMFEYAVNNETITYYELLELTANKKSKIDKENKIKLKESLSSTAAYCGESARDAKSAPHGIVGYFNDIESAIACSKKLKKPLLIYFTGYAAVNCRRMEEKIWGDLEVMKSLNEDYVLVYLYLDDKTELPESQWEEITFKGSGNTAMINTEGKRNSRLQQIKYEVNMQPYFVVEDIKGKNLRTTGFTMNVGEFLEFLKQE
jgi:thioredoxin-related protein